MEMETEIDAYEEGNRVIVEVEFNGVTYSEEFPKEGNIDEIRNAVGNLLQEIHEDSNIPPSRRGKIENQIFKYLHSKKYITDDDILALIS